MDTIARTIYEGQYSRAVLIDPGSIQMTQHVDHDANEKQVTTKLIGIIVTRHFPSMLPFRVIHIGNGFIKPVREFFHY